MRSCSARTKSLLPGTRHTPVVAWTSITTHRTNARPTVSTIAAIAASQLLSLMAVVDPTRPACKIVRMRAAVALLWLAACGRWGFEPPVPEGGTTSNTSLRVQISAAPTLTIANLDARIAFATIDPNALYGVPAAGGAPALPVEQSFAIPDVSGTATITFAAIDQRGRRLAATASADIVAGDGGTTSVVIGSDVVASCTDNVKQANEVDVDCGGPCPACAVGQTCLVGTDCGTGFCGFGFCELATGPPGWNPITDAPRGR